LLRESDRWYISDRGIHQPADAREVELFLAALADLRVYGLLPGERYEEEDYLPEQGTATRIAIGGSGQSARTLWISCNPEPSDTALARLNPEAEVFQISGRRALVLNRPAGTYRLSWRLDLSRIPEKCEEFRFQKGDSSLLSSRPDTLAQWLRKLEGMPLGRPVPSPESMPVVWQMECLEGTGELTWMVLFKDSLRRTYLLESSQAPNLYFPLDSALATPPFLPVDGGR